MARIAGVDLPKDKRVEIGLTYVYGIGRTSAKKILEMTGINPDTRVKDLTDEEEAKIRECIDHNFIVEGDLRRRTALDIKRLTEIGCYRGLPKWLSYDAKKGEGSVLAMPARDDIDFEVEEHLIVELYSK